jgi:hypothetical protein
VELPGAGARSRNVGWWLAGCALGVSFLVLTASIDVVQLEGDHASFLVLAPFPTLGFVHGGGEEGAWRRAHPTGPAPWWLTGRYFVLFEITDA